MLIFLSGRDGNADPEFVLGGRGLLADLMLTYVLSVKKSGKPTVRFQSILTHRKKELKRDGRKG